MSPPKARSEALLRKSAPPAGEAMVLATCHRTELYRYGPPPGSGLSPAAGLPAIGLESGLKTLRGAAALRHLCRVSAGLESTVRGEHEVLGQVGVALRAAIDAGTCGPVLNHLGRGALTLGRRARAETSIASGSVSLSGAAVAAAAVALGGLRGRRAVVVGSGMMAEKLLRALSGRELAAIAVVARNDRARQSLARASGAVPHPWPELRQVVADADVVLLATSASAPVLGAADLPPSQDRAVVDLGAPPNADEGLTGLPGTVVIDLESLMHRCQANLAQREGSVAAIKEMIEACVAAESAWLEARRAHGRPVRWRVALSAGL
jgi:glutamyl-tRNA reductase